VVFSFGRRRTLEWVDPFKHPFEPAEATAIEGHYANLSFTGTTNKIERIRALLAGHLSYPSNWDVIKKS